MAFRFSMQKIVDLKGNQKTQAEWLLAEAINKLREVELSLNQLYEDLNHHHELLRRMTERPTPIKEVQFQQQYIDHLETLIAKTTMELSAALTNKEAKQQVLLEKTLDEKVWLKTREKAQLDFNAFMLKKEQNELDEMAAVRHGNQA